MFKQVAAGRLPFYLIITLLFLLAHFARQVLEEKNWLSDADGLAKMPCQDQMAARRIVSLAPNITESLYALGLGQRIVGVTRYCNWPPDATSKARVGGFGQVDLEALLRKQPDLVILPHDQTESAKYLKNLGLEILFFKSRNIDDLLESIANIGQSTGQFLEAAQIRSSFDQAMKVAKQKAMEETAKGRARPRVLFVAMHNSLPDAGEIGEITVIGNDGFYSRLIGLAGGENAWQSRLAFPRLSVEAIIRCDPDIIIDVLPSPAMLDITRQAWQSLKDLKAVKNGRLHLLTDNAHTIPGPRAIQTLALLSGLFYPDQDEAGDKHRGDGQ